MGADRHRPGGGASPAYVLRLGQPVFLDRADQDRMFETGEVARIVVESVDWMAAPLTSEGRTLGVVVVQSYDEPRRHTRADLDLLVFVAQHIGTALARARAIEETRQRNEELALVNEIGLALAKQLDFAAIIRLVGDRIGAVFGSDSVAIVLYDEKSNILAPRTCTTAEPRSASSRTSWDRG